jgi:hypothetical protein
MFRKIKRNYLIAVATIEYLLIGAFTLEGLLWGKLILMILLWVSLIYKLLCLFDLSCERVVLLKFSTSIASEKDRKLVYRMVIIAYYIAFPLALMLPA